MEVVPNYIGVHHLVASVNDESRKAQLVLTGAWKWTKPFACRRGNLRVCEVCSEHQDLDLAHLIWKCKNTRKAMEEYEVCTGEETTVESLRTSLGSLESTRTLTGLLESIYDQLVITYSASPAVD
jgi:hypothetical protein